MAWSAPVTIAEPAVEPVTLEEAKEFLSIAADETEFDALIRAFIGAAREQIEAVTGTRLVEQSVELRADAWSDLMQLPIGPATAIEAVSYVDGDGVLQLVDAASYELGGAGLSQMVLSTGANGWPSGARRAQGAIRVRLTVGYAKLPRPLWTAMLLMVGDLFAFRETAVTGTVAAKIPVSTTVDAMLTNHRIW